MSHTKIRRSSSKYEVSSSNKKPASGFWLSQCIILAVGYKLATWKAGKKQSNQNHNWKRN